MAAVLPENESGQEESGYFVFTLSLPDGSESGCGGFTENGNYDIPGIVGAPSHCHRESRNEPKEALRLCS